MKNSIKYYAPIGISFKTIFWFIAFQYGIIILNSFNFFNKFHDALYTQERLSYQTGQISQMENFATLVRLMFPSVPLAFFACLCGLGIYNFGHHYKESQSVYLMKRLPNKYEYFRRVMTIPIISALLLLVLVFVLLMTYYVIYISKSPEGSVASGQLKLLFDVWFMGGTV